MRVLLRVVEGLVLIAVAAAVAYGACGRGNVAPGASPGDATEPAPTPDAPVASERAARHADASETPPPPDAETLSLRGTVIDDATNSPIAGAAVQAYREPPPDPDPRMRPEGTRPAAVDPLGTATSKEDGSFAIPVKVRERHLLAATAAGYAAGSKLGTPPGEIQIRLRRVTIHEIQVLAAEDRSPIAGATVRTIVGTWSQIIASTTTTDREGRARVEAAADTKLLVTAPGRAPGGGGGKHPSPILLQQAGSVGGVVIDDVGAPISGAEVTPRGHGLPVQTDAAGRFACDGLLSWMPNGLAVSAAGHVVRETPVCVGDDKLRIVLPRLATLMVTVLDAKGQPVRGADVDVKPVEPAGIRLDPAISARDGRFELPVPATGALVVRARSVLEVRSKDRGVERPEATGEIELGAGDRATIHEVVVRLAAPPPISYARIEAFDRHGIGVVVRRFIGAGALEPTSRPVSPFRVAFELPPGSEVDGRLRAEATGGARFVETPVHLKTSADPDVAATRVEVTSDPIPNVVVKVRAVAPDGGPLPKEAYLNFFVSDLSAGGPVNSDGTTDGFVLQSGRRYRIEARANGFASVWKDVDAASLGTSPVELRVTPAAHIRGRVLGPDGAPARNVSVYSKAGQGSDGVHDDGAFDMPLFRNGTVDVSIMWGQLNGPAWTGTATVGPAETVDLGDIRIPRPVELKGSVVTQTGEPAVGAVIVLVRAEFGVGGFGSEVMTDSSGTFTMRFVPGTRGKLLARMRRHGAVWRDLGVLVDGRPPMEIALPPECKVRVRIVGDPDRLESVNTVGLRTIDGTIQWWAYRFVERTHGGRIDVALDGVAAGRYVVFTEGSGQPFQAEVEFVADKVNEVTVK